jgi:hypothetical protein
VVSLSDSLGDRELAIMPEARPILWRHGIETNLIGRYLEIQTNTTMILENLHGS